MTELQRLVPQSTESGPSFQIPRKSVATANQHETSSLSSANRAPPQLYNVSDKKRHIDFDKSRLQHKRSSLSRDWSLEVASYLVALLALAAIIVTLRTHQDKPIPKWPKLISINSLLAIFSAILKASMILPIAEGISELKWHWFYRPQPLFDMEHFDSASRGPLGSLLLLLKLPRATIPCLGAIITVCALAIDPFTQQILHYYPCPQYLNSAATIMTTSTYNKYGYVTSHSTGVPDFHLDGPMTATLYQGLLNPVANASVGVITSCLTGNCTFPEADGMVYSSLAMCSSVTDVSHTISGYSMKTPYEWIYNYTLPSGTFVRSTNTSLLSVRSDISGGLCDSQILIAGLANCPGGLLDGTVTCDLNPVAFNVSIYPCVRTYANVSINSGILEEKVIREVSLPYGFTGYYRDEMYYSIAGPYPSRAGLDCTPAKSPVGSKTQATDELSDGTRFVNQSEWYEVDDTTMYYDPGCVYGFGTSTFQPMTNYLKSNFFGNGAYNQLSLLSESQSPTQTDGQVWLQILYNNGTANLSSVQKFMSGLADTITTTMRNNGDNSTDPLRGEAMIYETCIGVRWAWLALTGTLLLLAFIFLAATIWLTRKSADDSRNRTARTRRSAWKSSSLPLLWSSLSDDLKKRYSTVDDLDAMKTYSKNIHVQLRRQAPDEAEDVDGTSVETDYHEQEMSHNDTRPFNTNYNKGKRSRWILDEVVHS